MRHYNAIPGLLCVARFQQLWHRARIVQPVRPDRGTVKVHFFDYGTTASVPLTDVRYMVAEFVALPVQAHRGTLDFVRPANGRRWSPDATYAFLDLVAQVMLYGVVMHRDAADGVARLALVNTTAGVEDVVVHERLLLRKLAQPYSEMVCNEMTNKAEAEPTTDSVVEPLPLAEPRRPKVRVRIVG